MSRPTIYDVAREAGVGLGTVSRVLNNSPKVSESTRQRVLETMRRLDFKPNSVARKLPRRTRLHNIGVITQPFNSYYSFVERLRGVQTVLSEHDNDYELVLYNASSLTNLASQLETIVRDATVECLLIIDLDLTPEQQAALQQVGIPYVGINNSITALSPRVGIDNVEGARMATQYLLDLGHERIAYIGDPFRDPRYGFTTSEERYRGYAEALANHGLSVDESYVRLGEHGYEQAAKMALTLLDLPQPPSAIFAMSDTQALGCLAALRGAGLRVPQDIAIFGYDDLEISQHMGLSTLRQHLELSGRLSSEYLLHVLHKAEGAPALDLPPPEVIPRQTT